jgi:light-regulated signal transduction histidine kinase (bacteriophytochrome)
MKRIERGVIYQPVSNTAPNEQYWENIGVPQFDESGEVITYIEISRNITDQMQVTRKLKAANKDLEAFVYSVSHDLHAPLRHIDGFLKLLEKRMGAILDEQSKHYMNTIFASANKMEILIDDLLSFFRMGRNALSFQKVALGQLVHDILYELESNATDRVIHWDIGDLPVVRGDKAMLRIVLVNLITNALKFTRPRPQACIEIESKPGNNLETVICVRDNGVGFGMTYGDKLFGVF